MLGDKIRKVIDHRIINERLDGLTFQGMGKNALEELDELIEKANRVDELENRTRMDKDQFQNSKKQYIKIIKELREELFEANKWASYFEDQLELCKKSNLTKKELIDELKKGSIRC